MQASKVKRSPEETCDGDNIILMIIIILLHLFNNELLVCHTTRITYNYARGFNLEAGVIFIFGKCISNVTTVSNIPYSSFSSRQCTPCFMQGRNLVL